MLTFAEPVFLRVGVALVALVAVGLWSHARRRRRLAEFLGGRLGAGRVSRSDLYRRPIERILLLGLAAFALAAAAAGPSWTAPEVEEPPPEPPRSLVLAIDVSASMQADDAIPNRLAVATAAANDLIGRLSEHRIGLLLYAGRTYPLAPPTRDHAALAYLLGGVTSTIASAHDPGSLPSLAVTEAAAMLERWVEDAGQSEIVLIGDGGAGEPGSALENAIRAAAAGGARVHTIGVGTAAGAGMVMPEAPFQLGGRIMAPGGGPARSRLQAENLARIAELGGGTFVVASDPAAVADLGASLATPSPTLAPPPVQEAPLWTRYDLTFWLAATALLLLFLESLLNVRLPARARAVVRRPA